MELGHVSNIQVEALAIYRSILGIFGVLVTGRVHQRAQRALDLDHRDRGLVYVLHSGNPLTPAILALGAPSLLSLQALRDPPEVLFDRRVLERAVLKVLLIIGFDDQIDVRPVKAQAGGMRAVDIHVVVRELLLDNTLDFADQYLLHLLHFVHDGIRVLLEQQNLVVEHVLDPVEVVARGHLGLVTNQLQPVWCLNVRLAVGASCGRWRLL